MPDRPRPTCPMCGELGIHPTTEQCLEALRAAVDLARTQLALRADPAVRVLGRWVPSFWP